MRRWPPQCSTRSFLRFLQGGGGGMLASLTIVVKDAVSGLLSAMSPVRTHPNLQSTPVHECQHQSDHSAHGVHTDAHSVLVAVLKNSSSFLSLVSSLSNLSADVSVAQVTASAWAPLATLRTLTLSLPRSLSRDSADNIIRACEALRTLRLHYPAGSVDTSYLARHAEQRRASLQLLEVTAQRMLFSTTFGGGGNAGSNAGNDTSRYAHWHHRCRERSIPKDPDLRIGARR